jgi:hypothetical protein
MYRCLDTDRFHFIEGDTDSAYWAIAGDPTLGNDQAFQAIVTDQQFYDDNIFLFAPYDFYCFDESKRPVFSDPLSMKAHEKKLLGLAIEKQGDNMLALCPKCYTTWNADDTSNPISLKMKGVSKRQNKSINASHYLDVLFNDAKIDGTNINLTTKNGTIVKVEVNKTALTGVNTKGVTTEQGCVMPFIQGATYAT